MQYIKADVRNFKAYLSMKGEALTYRAPTPLLNTYQPDIDTSEEIGPKEASYYQSFIGILRLMLELVRVDICVEASMISSHLELPRRGHLEQVLHMFGYIKNIPMQIWYLIKVNLLSPTNTSNVKTGI